MENKTLFGKDTYNTLTTREPLTKDLPDKAQTLFSGHCFHNRSLHTFVKRRKLAWFGHVTRHDSLSKTIVQGTLEGGHCCDRRGNTGWTTPKSEHPCAWQNCSQESPAEKTGIGFLLNRPSCPPDHPFGHLVCVLNCILQF